MTRTVFIAVALAGFLGLAALDFASGAWRTGVAALMLALANGLLLTA